MDEDCRTKKTFNNEVSLVSWSPSMDVFILASLSDNSNRHIMLYHYTWKLLWKIAVHYNADNLKHLSWRPDGRFIALHYATRTVIIDVENGQTLKEYEHKSDVCSSIWFEFQANSKVDLGVMIKDKLIGPNALFIVHENYCSLIMAGVMMFELSDLLLPLGLLKDCNSYIYCITQDGLVARICLKPISKLYEDTVHMSIINDLVSNMKGSTDNLLSQHSTQWIKSMSQYYSRMQLFDTSSLAVLQSCIMDGISSERDENLFTHFVKAGPILKFKITTGLYIAEIEKCRKKIEEFEQDIIIHLNHFGNAADPLAAQLKASVSPTFFNIRSTVKQYYDLFEWLIANCELMNQEKNSVPKLLTMQQLHNVKSLLCPNFGVENHLNLKPIKIASDNILKYIEQRKNLHNAATVVFKPLEIPIINVYIQNCFVYLKTENHGLLQMDESLTSCPIRSSTQDYEFINDTLLYLYNGSTISICEYSIGDDEYLQIGMVRKTTDIGLDSMIYVNGKRKLALSTVDHCTFIIHDLSD